MNMRPLILRKKTLEPLQTACEWVTATCPRHMLPMPFELEAFYLSCETLDVARTSPRRSTSICRDGGCSLGSSGQFTVMLTQPSVHIHSCPNICFIGRCARNKQIRRPCFWLHPYIFSLTLF